MADILTPPQAPDEHPRRTSLYRYYDEFGTLIYVGITNRGITRNREHNIDKDWWQYVARQEVDHFDTRPEALKQEKRLIHTYRPPFNKQHNPDSASLRAAYVAYRAMPNSQDPLALAQSLDRRLPLVPFSTDETGADRPVLITLLEHAPIASRLRAREKGVSLQGTGKGAGWVEAVVQQGPVALIRLSKKTARPIQSAFGSLKFPKARPVGSIVELTSVQVILEPEEWRPSLCRVPGCPQLSTYKSRCIEHAADLVISDEEVA